jgi:enoyl-CoA hydratase/carnithine racemase
VTLTGVARILTVAAERHPDAEAVIDGERRLRYGALDARVNRLAAALLHLGLRCGDHAVFLLKNRVAHVTAYWACQKIGAIATPLNWRFSEGETRYCVEDAEGVVVVFEAASRDAVLGARGGVLGARDGLAGVRAWIYAGDDPPRDTVPFDTLVAGETNPGPPATRIDDADTSIMLYTSGTTGRPKGVPRSHRAELSASLAHIVQSGVTFGDRTLGVMPLYHTMGVRSMIAMALLNGALVCLADWSPAVAAQLIAEERITSLYLVPTLYHDLVSRPDLSRYDLSSATTLGYAGAPMASTLAHDVARVFRPRKFLNHLGSTEVYTFTVCDRVLEKPRELQAPAPVRAGGVAAEEPDGQVAPAPSAGGMNQREVVMSEFLRVERTGAVATLWIDRQAKMNTMTVAMREEFPGLFRDLDADESVRVVVLRGAGGKAFSAGGDLAEFLTLAPADLEQWGDTLTAAERCRKPVVAAIDGFAMGAGLELALACDIRIATRRSEFAFPEIRLGMIPGSGGTQRALRLMGMTRAKLFMMTGRRIGAAQAEAWGLITEAVADDALDAATSAVVGELAERAPLALRTLKTVLNRGAEAPIETALELERKAYAWLRSTHDYAEGVTSFLEKRPPKYEGR